MPALAKVEHLRARIFQYGPYAVRILVDADDAQADIAHAANPVGIFERLDAVFAQSHNEHGQTLSPVVEYAEQGFLGQEIEHALSWLRDEPKGRSVGKPF